jgi:hypothetical protein
MTCNECQLQIFDGDLDRDAVVHLTECEDCRELDREVRLNGAALAELRDEPLPAARPSRKWQPWVAAAIAAAAALAMVLSAPWDFPRPPVIGVDPPVVAQDKPLPAPEIRILNVRPVVKPKPQPKRELRPQPKAAVPEEPMLVKFLTDDPEVVVYWIVDPNQGEPGL